MGVNILPKITPIFVTRDKLHAMMMMMIGVLGRVDCNGHFAPITTK